MSLIPTPQEVADAAGRAAERVADEIGADAPGVFERLLDALANYEVVIGFRRRT